MTGFISLSYYDTGKLAQENACSQGRANRFILLSSDAVDTVEL